MDSMQAINSAKSHFAIPPDSEATNSDRALRIRIQSNVPAIGSLPFMRVMVYFRWRVMPRVQHVRLFPHFPCNGKPELGRPNRKSAKLKKRRNFPRGCARKGLLPDEDGVRRPQGSIQMGTPTQNKNHTNENHTYRQSVRHHPFHRSCRFCFGPPCEQAHRPGRFERKIRYQQRPGGTQSHEKRRSSGQRLPLHPLNSAFAETEYRPVATAAGRFYDHDWHHAP